jgi:hypothetical protein
MRWHLNCLLAVVLAVIAVACVPIPIMPGDDSNSRGDLAKAPLGAIVVGHSSRQDVLELLGEPDDAAPDGSWFRFDSARSNGGLGGALIVSGGGGFAAARETVTYRRIAVDFDANGVVSSSGISSATCPRWWAAAGKDSTPIPKTSEGVTACLNGTQGEAGKPANTGR